MCFLDRRVAGWRTGPRAGLQLLRGVMDVRALSRAAGGFIAHIVAHWEYGTGGAICVCSEASAAAVLVVVAQRSVWLRHRSALAMRYLARQRSSIIAIVRSPRWAGAGLVVALGSWVLIFVV
jgi:hypothetical protein